MYVGLAGSHLHRGEATTDQKAAIEAQLKGATLGPFIDKYTFQSHQQAYDEYQRMFGGTAAAQLMTPQTTNEAYWITLKDQGQADVIVQGLKGAQGIEEIRDFRQVLDPIFNTLNIASVTAVSIAVVMLVAAALLIATTIRLSAIARRRELGIMRLVGASNRFIQAPFVLEGVLAGFIGALLASGTLALIVKFFVAGTLSQTTSLFGYAYVGLSDALLITPFLIAVSVILAAASAAIAISRYLRV